MAKTNTKKEKIGPKPIVNRKARFEYHIEDEYEAGLVLVGSEVKSLFHGKVNLTDGFCRVLNGEMWLMQLDIEPYSHTTNFQHERRRDRKLLLHKKEIEVLGRKSQEKGLAIIPLEIYFKTGRAKVKIALARGKANYDKRDAIAKNDTRREIERAKSEKYR
jgi:SsrA-binding protein